MYGREIFICAQKTSQRYASALRDEISYKIILVWMIWLIVIIALYKGIVPLFYNIYYGLHREGELREALKPYFNHDIMVSESITDDIMITAWNYNERRPTFFTKKNCKYEIDSVLPILDTLDAAVASASTPYYFRPATIDI